MEASSPATVVPSPPSSLPLDAISQRLVRGLQVDVIFPHSSYLDNVKAELKKVLKQRYSLVCVFVCVHAGTTILPLLVILMVMKNWWNIFQQLTLH